MITEQQIKDNSELQIPSVRSARVLFFLTIGLVVVLGSVAQHYNFWLGLTFTEIILILSPVLIFIYKQNFSVRKVLRLNSTVPISQVLIAIVLGVLIWPLGLWIQLNLMEIFYTRDANVISSLSELSKTNMLYRFLVLGILASVCEEFLFRGYIQSAFERNLGVRKSIIWTTVMFSIYHLDPATIIALFPMSFLLTWICWRFNSIIPAIVLHFANNFVAAFIYSKITFTNISQFYFTMIACTLILFLIVHIVHKRQMLIKV